MIGQAPPTEFETNYLITQEQSVHNELGPGPAKDYHFKRLADYRQKLFDEVNAARSMRSR